MGLDIYLHKTKCQFDYEINEENYHEIIESEDDRCRGLLAKEIASCIRKLTEASNGNLDAASYEKLNKECLEAVASHFSYPEFNSSMNKIGYDAHYDPDKHDYVPSYSVVPVTEWIKNTGKLVEHHHAQNIAYFRKVNLLFAYFQDKGTLVDEYFAPIDKATCLDIIDRCEKVLADHMQCDKLLPCRSGFFFGSTAYDEWYFKDVENVLKQFRENVLPVYDEPCWEKGEVGEEYENEKMNCYIVFSW